MSRAEQKKSGLGLLLVQARETACMIEGPCWAGWLWSRGRWELVASRLSLAKARLALHRAASAAGVHPGDTLLTRGELPAAPPAKRRPV
jgi:hypothetical protein